MASPADTASGQWRTCLTPRSGCPRPILILIVAVIVLALQGCAVLPYYKHPNTEDTAEPIEPVGTYNASLNVPWSYDFTNVSERQAAECRRHLANDGASSRPDRNPCDEIPRDNNFVALAVSGGGSRSAGLAMSVMWELDRIGVLKHVDVISAVSGGSQAAALYALTRDLEDVESAGAEKDRYTFDPDDPRNVVGVFSRNLTLDWFVSLLMPWHLGPYLVTYFDRTDTMADTFADNYYPRGSWIDINWGQRFRDINPKRPNLILNAVDMSLRHNENDVPAGLAGACFPMSYETFRFDLGSNLHDFPIAQAVMASSAYPGIYNYLSIRDFRRQTPKGADAYIHLADGGIRDHLGLVPINAMIRRFADGRPLSGLRAAEIARSCEFSRGVLVPTNRSQEPMSGKPPTATVGPQPRLPEKILIIVIDAGRPPLGYREDDADPRANLGDRIVPVTKVIDSVDAILDDQRALRVVELVSLRRNLTGKRALEEKVRRCLKETSGRADELAQCLKDTEDSETPRRSGVFGAACCPVIGLGIHDFTKFADQKFGPLKADDLDSDQVWGTDHVTLECLEDNDFGRGRPDSLYSKVRKMNISLSLAPEELSTVRLAGRALVDGMIADFCDPETHILAGVDGIPCTPPPVPRDVKCKLKTVQPVFVGP